MQIDDFLEVIRSRRSCRRFKPGPPIPDENITKMLEAARWAMSGANGQPWEFIVIKDLKTIEKMNDITVESTTESYLIEQTRVEEFRHPAAFGTTRHSSLENASAVIVVLGDRRALQATSLRSWVVAAEGGPGAHYYKNIANATQNLHLAAAAMGLATRWHSVQRSNEEALKRLLDVPDVLDIHTLVAVGHRALEPQPPYRRELKEFVHFEKYDRAKYRSMKDVIEYLADLRRRSKAAYRQV